VGEMAMGACLKHVIFGVLIHVIYPYLSNELFIQPYLSIFMSYLCYVY
jgi:hypothetical protein